MKRVCSKPFRQFGRHLIIRALLAKFDRVRLQSGILVVLGLKVDNDAVENVFVVLRDSCLDVLQCQLGRSVVKKVIGAILDISQREASRQAVGAITADNVTER